MIFLLYLLCTPALYYLGSRAQITSFLWRRYPRRLDRLMGCAACSGFWYGLAVGGLGAWREWSFLSLPGRDWLTVVLIGLCSLFWTPILARLHIQAVAQTTVEGSDGQET